MHDRSCVMDCSIVVDRSICIYHMECDNVLERCNIKNNERIVDRCCNRLNRKHVISPRDCPKECIAAVINNI